MMQSNRLVKLLQEAGFTARAFRAQNKDHVSLNNYLSSESNDQSTRRHLRAADPVVRAMIDTVGPYIPADWANSDEDT